MGTTLNNFDTMLASAATHGLWTRFYTSRIAVATSSPGISTSYVSGRRFPTTIMFPSVGGGLTGAYMPYCRLLVGATGHAICALEYTLGTITMSTGAFTSGVTMPTKTVRGTSLQTATELVLAVVTTATSGGTTPTLTITYTNQDGTGSKTVPVGALGTGLLVNTAFLIGPLASGDTGVQQVTNITTDHTNTTGIIKIMGLLVLGLGTNGSSSLAGQLDPLAIGRPLWLCEANETIAFYLVGDNNAANTLYAALSAVAEN